MNQLTTKNGAVTEQPGNEQPANEQPVNPNQALWEKGDFTKIAETMRRSGQELVAKLGIRSGMKVLDLGCGDGTTAIPAAELGAEVTGIDISRTLVSAGKKRIAERGFSNITIEQGDAMDLNKLKDQSFDRSISIFGAMFAPRPDDVAKELVRVTKKGGKIIMGNWIPGDPTIVSQILRISGIYNPPPEGFISPAFWGKEEIVIDRFGKAGIPKENISFEKAVFTFEADFGPKDYLDRFKNFYGPTMNAFETAAKNNKSEQLYNELLELFERHNESEEQDKILVNANYLLVTVNV
ncbi:MAG: class I SAM-dependent methyltransferase [Flavitalea sp.]